MEGARAMEMTTEQLDKCREAFENWWHEVVGFHMRGEGFSTPAEAAWAAWQAAKVTQLLTMTDEQRRKIFSQFCTYCGDKYPNCQCWNDE